MGLHQDILSSLVDTCMSIHDKCGVVLIGSVARGAERAGSDIDLNVIFPCDESPLHRSAYIEDDNRWQLKVKDKIQGIRIDVAWDTQRALLERLASADILNCWPFSNGLVLYDPYNVAGPCLKIARDWFAKHPNIAARYERKYVESKKKQQLLRKNKGS